MEASEELGCLVHIPVARIYSNCGTFSVIEGKAMIIFLTFLSFRKLAITCQVYICSFQSVIVIIFVMCRNYGKIPERLIFMNGLIFIFKLIFLVLSPDQVENYKGPHTWCRM